jgi:hypothetical protein
MFSCVGRGLAASDSPHKGSLQIFIRFQNQKKWKDLETAVSCASQESKGEEEIESVSQLRWLVAGFPPRRFGFEPRSGHVGFVVDRVALGQVFSKYFGFPCQFSFPTTDPHSSSSIIQDWYNRTISGRRTKMDSVSPHPKKLQKQKEQEQKRKITKL